MLVSELKKLMKNYTREELGLLAVEMYKAIPKKIRDEKNVDIMVKDIHAFLAQNKAGREKKKAIDLSVLQYEINQFLSDAYNQYYFAPNQFVRKKERPKWRFKVKEYIKDLESVPCQGKDALAAADLLKKLYILLCDASVIYLFNTEDPFRSVGIEQPALADLVISRILAQGINNESLRQAIGLVIEDKHDRETLPSHLILKLVGNLKTPQAKSMAIEESKLLNSELRKALQTSSSNNKKRSSSQTDVNHYLAINKINNLVETVLRLAFALYEYEEGIRYFRDNYLEQNKEIALYVLLELLFEYDLKDFWLKEYERALAQGIKPRKGLQSMAAYTREKNELPDTLDYQF
ncbi:hypothetical protein [Desulfitobacterium sp.]|uniref:hypothetical protein n=1 Tax=Desulfitobacterium sp. TaxID=49981 RepID=UPI002B213E6A|nr:hypothetical protein [Desulfitobacterium sp.]MEA4902892.1 hypothetical protein [Desulfitobacterium sp.]